MSASHTKPRCYRFGVFEVQTATQELRKRGLRMKIAGQPFHILTLLLDKQGEIVTREELRRAIWPEESWGDHDQRLNKAMTKVREVLSDSADTPRYIETIPRIGYRFLLHVEILESPDPTPPAAPEADPLPPPPKRTLSPLWIGAPLLLAGVSILLYFYASRPTSPANLSLISRPLTTFIGAEHSPNFSPDGKQIVFAWTGEAGANEDLFLTDPVSGGARRLTTDPLPDTAPVFSPEGKLIAFRRASGVWLLDLTSSAERKLTDIESTTAPGTLAWTPDGNWVVSSSRSNSGNLALFAIETATGQRRQLTHPPAGQAGDRSAVFSPDGRLMAFTRHTAPEWREVFIADFDPATNTCRGELRRLTQQKLRIDQLAFTNDGREILFSGATPSGGSSYISRLQVSTGQVQDLAGVRVEGNNFALAPDGGSIVVSRRSSEATSLRKLNLAEIKAGRLLNSEPLLRSTAPDYSPDISTDGKFVVMSSSRSGTPQLWVFPLDQPAPKRLTFLGNSGASVPRWSPNAQYVCFESRPDGQSDIFTIETASGTLSRITNSAAQESRCSWSRDGRHLYYGSGVEGRMEIFRMSHAEPKLPPLRVTSNGGNFAVESPDAQWLYYSTPEPKVEIRRRALNSENSPEETLATQVLGRSALAVGRSGIYYLGLPDSSGRSRVFFQPHQSRKAIPIHETSSPVHNAISLSSDEKWLIFTELLRPESDLHLFTGLR